MASIAGLYSFGDRGGGGGHDGHGGGEGSRGFGGRGLFKKGRIGAHINQTGWFGGFGENSGETHLTGTTELLDGEECPGLGEKEQ